MFVRQVIAVWVLPQLLWQLGVTTGRNPLLIVSRVCTLHIMLARHPPQTFVMRVGHVMYVSAR